MILDMPDWSKAKVLVVGDVMLDRYWYGGTSRISPEAPVPVVHVHDVEERIGGAGNVAQNITALNGQAVVIGVVGDDEAAHIVEKKLQDSRVQPRLLTQAGTATVTKLRVISRHQQLIRMDFEDAPESIDIDKLETLYKQALDEVDLVVLSDYNKGVLRNAQKLIELAAAVGKPVVVDPKRKDFSVYSGATLLTPNLGEFEAVVGLCNSDEEIVTKAQTLLEQYQLYALLITRGEHGMTLVESGQDPIHLPACKREVFDVTGAGDTVVSVIAATLAAGESMARAIALSNVAAGIAVSKLGTATVSAEELQRELHHMHEYRYGMTTEEELVSLIEDAKKNGETIVMTNGCFDILHAGHVQYLQEARKLGRRLIVAVNDDESVKRLKGESRPINALENRMAVLAGLESVDWVVPFSEDTPESLICRLLPHVLVKGGDYKIEEIAGAPCVLKAGGEVKILKFKEGCSTSNVIETIRNTPS